MRSTKIISLIVMLLSGASPAGSHEILTNWKPDKKSEDIEISYRQVEVGDTLKTRQMRITFMIDAYPDQLIPMFKNSDHLTAWSAGTKKCDVIQDYDTTWITYSVYDIPWPFNKRDLVTEYKMVKTDSQITLFLTGKPDRVPLQNGITRMEKYQGQWVFIPLGNGKTRVEFYSIAFARPIIPRFIQDPVVQRILIDSINKLKALLNERV